MRERKDAEEERRIKWCRVNDCEGRRKQEEVTTTRGEGKSTRGGEGKTTRGEGKSTRQNLVIFIYISLERFPATLSSSKM